MRTLLQSVYHGIFYLTLALVSAIADENIIHYDNLDEHGEDPQGNARAIKYWNEAPGKLPAQRFTASADNVTTVTMGLARLGSPGGKVELDILQVDSSNGRPGASVGNFAMIEINSLPLVQQSSLPAFFDVRRIEGLVTGLIPGQDYFLQLNDADGAVIHNSSAYVFTGARTPTNADLLWFYGGSWHTWDLPLHARIEGRPPAVLTATGSGDGTGTLTIEPKMDTYPLGTEVTVAAAAPEGSEFNGWKAEQVTQPFHMNVYDNIEHKRDRSNQSEAPEQLLAQQFVMDENTTLGMVELELFRKGSVAGSLAIELWNHDEATKDPGEKVADIGTIADASIIPTDDTVFTFDQPITDLSANAPYWIVINPAGITSTLDADNTIAWTVSISTNTAGSNGRINAHVRSDDDNTTWKSLGTTRFHQMRIKTLSELLIEPLDLPNENPVTFATIGATTISAEFTLSASVLIIETTEDGSVTKSPDLEKYPIGSEVTVTATPEEGLEFVKWTYGEEEFTTNPATIIVKEGTTLTPVFAEIEEPKPLQVDIETAVAVSWDSQSGKSYRIHASTDMENWEVAVDSIEGTGERLTHCFIREKTEVFYRVEEKR
jgi:hypothetical protein